MQLFRPLAACVVVMLAFASAIQSEYWATDVTLFARAVDRAPDNEWAQLNYGSALSARGKFADAAPHFARSYELKPGWRAADFAGFAYQQSGDLSQAEQMVQNCAAIRSLPGQRLVRTVPGFAAAASPGTSNHGFKKARCSSNPPPTDITTPGNCAGTDFATGRRNPGI